MFCCSLVSEDVRLAFVFIVLLRLAGVARCFSTHSVPGPFFTVWLPYLDALLDVACQPAGPISSFVSAVKVCPHRFPLDFSALGAYVPFLWSTWCASWESSSAAPLLCFHRRGFCLLGLVSSLVWLTSRRCGSAFEKRVHHAVPRQLAVLNMPVCCLQPKNRQRLLGEFWVKNRLRTPPPRRLLKREFIMRFPGNMQS